MTTMIYIGSDTCLICGNKFIKAPKGGKHHDNIATDHHAIPEIFKPSTNVKLQICWKCHKKMHLYFKLFQETSKEKIKKIMDEINELTNTGLLQGENIKFD